MRRTTLAIVAVLLLTAVPALADHGDKGDWEFGIYGGYGWLDDYGPFQPKDDWLYGARVGYFFTSRWNMELSGQRLSTNTEFDPSLGLNDTNVDLDALRLNLLYNFRPGKGLRPFLTVGAGCERFNAHSYGKSCDTGYNAGAGLRMFMSDNINLRLEGRYVRTHVGAGLNETEENLEATVGLGFLFGGRESKPCPSCPPPPPAAIAPACPQCPSCPSCPPAPACPPQERPAPCPSGMIQQLMEKKAVVLEGVEFDNDRDTLRPESLRILNDVAESLRGYPSIRVEIQGHCSNTGSDAHNLELSDRRAAAVKNYLISKGVDASRLESRGFGETRPIATNATEAGRQKNRRVELHRIE